MSWDVIIFSSKQHIVTLEEIDEEQFIPIDFNAILEKYFDNIYIDEDHREIKGEDYSINYFADEEPTATLMFNLYGEKSLFELIAVSRKQGWQIFDTGNGEIINLDIPEKNGYQNFQNYLKEVLDRKDKKD